MFNRESGKGIRVTPTIREILLIVLLGILLFSAMRSAVHSSEINGRSMEPSLHDGQRVIVSKAAYWFSSPERGDIVIFETPRINNNIIHRIIGLPGESVEIRDGEAYIDGIKLDEPYIEGNLLNVPATPVPEDTYFIVGDNRYTAAWDIVPRDDIVGKAWLSYWPPDDWGIVAD